MVSAARLRQLWRAAFTTCLLVVLVLSLLPDSVPVPTTGWDKANHGLAFAVLALLGLRSFPDAAWRVLVGLLAYGGLIECLQSFTPDRFAEWADLAADGVGLALGWAAEQVEARRRRPGR